MSFSITKEIARIEDQFNAKANSITAWYHVKQEQYMMQMRNLETAYNERMAEHASELEQTLYYLRSEQKMLETGSQVDVVPPRVTLSRQTNLRLVDDNCAQLWNISAQEANDIEEEMLDDLPVPPLERTVNVQYLPYHLQNIHIDDILYTDNESVDENSMQISEEHVHIVSDDEDDMV